MIEAVGRALRKPIAPLAPAPSAPPAPQRASERAIVRLDVDWLGGKAGLRLDSGGQPLQFYWDGGARVERQR